MEVKDNECNVPRSQTNWKLCCFCQQKKNEKLVSPSDKSDKQASKIYEKIEKDIKNCITNNYDLPFNLTPNCLTVEGCEKISLSLNEKSAIYHQTCRDAIGVKFVEAQKKSKEVSNVLEIEIRDKTNWELCFFCQESGSKKDSLTRPYLKEYYHKSYKQIEKDLENCELNGFTVPFNLSTKCLITTNHNDMASSLLANKAVFHKKCRDKIGPERLERFLKAKAKRKMEEEEEGGTSSISPKKTRSSFESSFSRKSRQCVYCLLYDDDHENTEAISKAGDVGNTWKEMAKAAQNWAVYTRLCTAIDNTASDLSYHRSCYTKLYTEARSAERMSNAKVEGKNSHFDPFVIAELVAYMNQKDSEIKIVDLKSLYEQRLMQIGSNWCGKTVHSTRFKEHLLEKLGDDWMILKPDHEKSLVFTRNKIAPKVLLEHLTLEEEAQKIVEVGHILRKYILHPQPPFSGEFSSKILNESVPKQLLTLMRVLLEGADGIEVKEQSKITARVRVALTLSQLVISNSIKDKSEAQNLYQIKERETPFPLYMSLVLHCSGRKKKLIKNFHKVGVTVSHERTISIRKKIAQAVSARFQEQKVVVPLNCKRGVFTVGTTDNIDVSGRQDMHGTSITLIGQRTKENLGTDGPALNLEISDDTLIELPKEFSNVEFVEDVGEISNLQPVSNGSVSIIRKAWDSEVTEAWLAHVMTIFKKGREEKGWQLEELPVTFSGYFSKKQSEELVRPCAIVGTFPVFSEEKADSISMQRHAMKVVKDSIGYLNANQTPVIEGDLPLFAQQKKCQWLFKDELGEDKMVCMMGFLHLEMCIQEVGGKLLGGSGWERIFVLAKTYKSGVAASLLGGHKIKRTRQAYMVTLGWLNILRNNAYSTYCKASDCNDSIELWEERLFLSSPTACYWGKIIWRFLMIYCQFIHSQRIGDWTRCLEAIDDICPYFFAFGHTNYARWTPVFLRDMAQLPIRHPDVYKNFMNGNFVVQRSSKKFSLMGLDQSQEHSIQFLKQDSGPKGLYGDETEKLAIELSRADVLRLIEEYEVASEGFHKESKIIDHPECSPSEQRNYLNCIHDLLQLVQKSIIINPFEDTEDQLITLDSGECMDPEVTKSLLEAPETGKTLYTKYVKEVIEKCERPVSDVISKPKLFTFLNRPSANMKKGAAKLATTKASAAVVTQMFVSLQARPDSDMSDFFKYENSRFPPAISNLGNLRSGTKSQILDCIPEIPSPGKNPATKLASVVILDMPAVIHMVKPKRASVFSDYIPNHLIPFIKGQISSSTTRVDAIWDRYDEKSLKYQTRIKRIGKTRERRIRAADNIPMPKGKDWQAFLKVSENKEEMFKYLSDNLMKYPAPLNCHLLSTKGEIVLSNKPFNLTKISPSDHEEADTRMLLHLYSALMDNHKIAYIRTVDSDVVVICIHVFHKLVLYGLVELWIGFGSGKYYKDIPIHLVVNELGAEKCAAITFFHAFTGCDVTSSMAGIGKKTAWNVWNSFPEVTSTMIRLTENPSELSTDPKHMQLIERFTVLMYSKGCDATTVNEARQRLFTHNLKSLENIPPTNAALFQHVKRVLLISSFIWHKALQRQISPPNFNEYGWEWNDRTSAWMPYWTNLDDVSSACALLLHCGCAKSCKGNCKCSKAGIRCTPLCKCEGGCERNDHC